MIVASGVQAASIARRVDDALATHACESRRLSIANASIAMTVEGELASRLFAPFAHLASDDTDRPELHIAVAALRGDAPELDELPDSGVVLSEGETILHLHREAAIAFDRAASRIHALVRNRRGIASWHRAKPLQVPLSIFFADRGIDLLHGGLVSLRGNGLLLAGAGGSGKSTLSVAALLEGLDFLGDDCIAAQGTIGFSIFGSSCLERAHLQRFPIARAVEDDDEGEKDVLPLAQWFADRMVSSTTIRAIVLPRVTHADHVTIHPASGRDALLALAPSSILKRAVPAGEVLARMTRLVRDVPAYRLEMGPIAEAGARLRELLEDLSERRA
jgi:hypothetical protein